MDMTQFDAQIYSGRHPYMYVQFGVDGKLYVEVTRI